MKKVLSGCLIISLLFVMTINSYAVKLYNPDTKKEWEDTNDESVIKFLREKGFMPYEELPSSMQKKTTLYALDGRTIEVLTFLVEDYINVGWYAEPLVIMYTLDGRSARFSKSEVEAQKAVGWYAEPFVTMYAYDGRTAKFLQSEVEAQKTVGWYVEPFVTMYAYDGRTAKFLKSEVEAQKAVGWYDEPFVTMYAYDGRTAKFPQSEVSAQKKVGWYSSLSEIQNIKNQQQQEANQNAEIAKKFYVGAQVVGSMFSYEWHGTVKQVNGGKVLVNWDAFYDSYGYKITNQFNIINIEYATGIYINEPTWYDASKLYLAK